MTGFGRAELKSAHGPIRVEIKTTNHKFFELSSRLPGHLAEFEDAVRKIVSQEIGRGKINLFVSSPDPATYSKRLVLNESLAREAYQKIVRLASLLKIQLSAGDKGALLREVLRTPDVLTRDLSSERPSVIFKDVARVVNAALAGLKASRLQEGRALYRDLAGRLLEIRRALSVIERRIPVGIVSYKKNLKERMSEFMKEGDIDKERLTLEVAQFVKNSDISEEVTRMKSHLFAMKKAMDEKGELGRKIDFIAQEMYREANTMGAKSNDTAISAEVIRIKSAIEKIREQAQNVE